MTWMLRALCRTRPAEWWEFGDDGNRLALALCSVCPERWLCDVGREYGVIRAGTAWNQAGLPAGLCDCGYPLPYDTEVGERADCYRCVPRVTTRIPRVRRRRVVEPRAEVTGTREEQMYALHRQGFSYRHIGFEYGVSKTMVGRIVHKFRTRAVSTVVDAS